MWRPPDVLPIRSGTWPAVCAGGRSEAEYRAVVDFLADPRASSGRCTASDGIRRLPADGEVQPGALEGRLKLLMQILQATWPRRWSRARWRTSTQRTACARRSRRRAPDRARALLMFEPLPDADGIRKNGDAGSASSSSAKSRSSFTPRETEEMREAIGGLVRKLKTSRAAASPSGTGAPLDVKKTLRRRPLQRRAPRSEIPAQGPPEGPDRHPLRRFGLRLVRRALHAEPPVLPPGLFLTASTVSSSWTG